MRIPTRFITKYGEKLSNQAFLTLPNATEWKVELTTCDGEVWLQKGWQQFAEYCSIRPGHFLVFRYEGDSRFYVLVFDGSAIEIDYPLTRSLGDDDNVDEEFQVSQMEEIETENSVEVLEDFSTNKKRKSEASPSTCPQRHERVKTNPSAKTAREANETQSRKAKLDKLKARANMHSSMQDLGGVQGVSTSEQSLKSKIRRSIQTVTGDEKVRALEKANGFKAENPYFMVVMQPSYVRLGSSLNIPSDFSERYLNKSLDEVMLRVSDGRSWSVRYSFQMLDAKMKGQFQCGWKVFSQDNNLDVGDVCAFELISGVKKICFQVVIFRATAEHSPRSPGEPNLSARGGGQGMPDSSRCANERDRAFDRASAFNSENSFFSVTMGPAYTSAKGNLTVPAGSFLHTSCIKQSGLLVLLQVGDKSWPVKVLRFQHSSRVALCAGWPAFAKDNALEVGDVCVFEKIKDGARLLKVSIFRDLR
ncbi:B3 domain-containing transcription factor VRN1 [Morella rubra]|uniref:B3 domain-containing transcription factor VRN1 n=1 Tax=Morella rubra TaxID=262757 RepID=A0A6A1UXI5_9ROSI|nr:B3 domain-containing transcription factor VRN1 [Morella rubra]